VMLKLDELSGEVAGLAALRSSLAMLERMRKLEAAFLKSPLYSVWKVLSTLTHTHFKSSLYSDLM
jgi:hypothetical protein